MSSQWELSDDEGAAEVEGKNALSWLRSVVFFFSHAAALTAESVLLRMTSGRLQTNTRHMQHSATPAFFY